MGKDLYDPPYFDDEERDRVPWHRVVADGAT